MSLDISFLSSGLFDAASESSIEWVNYDWTALSLSSKGRPLKSWWTMTDNDPKWVRLNIAPLEDRFVIGCFLIKNMSVLSPDSLIKVKSRANDQNHLGLGEKNRTHLDRNDELFLSSNSSRCFLSTQNEQWTTSKEKMTENCPSFSPQLSWQWVQDRG